MRARRDADHHPNLRETEGDHENRHKSDTTIAVTLTGGEGTVAGIVNVLHLLGTTSHVMGRWAGSQNDDETTTKTFRRGTTWTGKELGVRRDIGMTSTTIVVSELPLSQAKSLILDFSLSSCLVP